jgi:hypothetical protein
MESTCINRLHYCSPVAVRPTAVLDGAGLVETLRGIYPTRPLVELWGSSMPICAFPAPPAAQRDLESPLGRLLDTRVPGPAEYAADFDPAGRPAFDAYVERHRTAGERGRRGFFSGPTYALHRLREDRETGARLDCVMGRYFTSRATSSDLDPELLAAQARDPARPVPLEALPRRAWLHGQVADPVVDGAHRSSALAHSTVVLLATGDGGHRVLLPPRSTSVATHPDFLHLAPAGVFAPDGEDPHRARRDFSVRRNFVREWLEELYGTDERELADPEAEPAIARLTEALRSGQADLRYTGVAVDLLTLRPEICLLLAIHDPEWLRDEPLRLSWEHSREDWFLALDADLRPADGRVVTPSVIVPAAAAGIWLAIRALRAPDD